MLSENHPALRVTCESLKDFLSVYPSSRGDRKTVAMHSDRRVADAGFPLDPDGKN